MTASEEWIEFEAALKLPMPAADVFTGEALMLIYLALGTNALKQSNSKSNTITNPCPACVAKDEALREVLEKTKPQDEDGVSFYSNINECRIHELCKHALAQPCTCQAGVDVEKLENELSNVAKQFALEDPTSTDQNLDTMVDIYLNPMLAAIRTALAAQSGSKERNE